MTKNFLFEIFTEEIPHSSILQLEQQLKKNSEIYLKKNKIAFKEIISFQTPCRLAILVKNMTIEIEEQKIIKRGPPVEAAIQQGSWSKQALGFINSCSLDDENLNAENISTEINSLKIEKENGIFAKGFVSGKDNQEKLFIVFQQTISKQKTIDILPKILKQVIDEFDIPKQMTWGEGDYFFIRPVHKIIALLGEEIVNCDFFGVKAGKQTIGYPNIADNEIIINTPEEYEEKLLEKFVIANGQKRKQKIEEQISKLEKENDFIVSHKNKLSEVNSLLTEFPNTILCDFPENFLEVPQEVLIAEMVEHQKYFPVLNKEKKLISKFIITSNSISDKNETMENIKNGNLRVIKARFSDGLFFYQQDIALGIDAMKESAKKTIYQKDLGSYHDKNKRMIAIANFLKKHFEKENNLKKYDFEKIIPLLKADLFSNVVFEFPELQGTIGKYYAKNKSYEEEICTAIEQHYFPKGETSEIPQNFLSCFLAIVNKLDNILGLFSVGVIPTGTSDVYALRRDAQGILRILIEQKIDLDLEEVIFDLGEKIYFKIFKDFFERNSEKKSEQDLSIEFNKLLKKIISFFEERLKKVVAKDKDIGFAVNDLVERYSSQRKNLNPFKAMEQMRVFQVMRNYDTSLEILKIPHNSEDKTEIQKITDLKKRIEKICSKYKDVEIQKEISENDLTQKEEKKLLADLEKNYTYKKKLSHLHLSIFSIKDNNYYYRELMENINNIEKFENIIIEKNYHCSLNLFHVYHKLFSLLPLINNFFENVFVEVEDVKVKQIRISLLQKVQKLFDEVLL